MRKIDIATIATLLLAIAGGVFWLGKLQGTVDTLNPNVIESKIDGVVTNLKNEHKTKLVPAGVILMWSGPIDAIPNGWALCGHLLGLRHKPATAVQ